MRILDKLCIDAVLLTHLRINLMQHVPSMSVGMGCNENPIAFQELLAAQRTQATFDGWWVHECLNDHQWTFMENQVVVGYLYVPKGVRKDFGVRILGCSLPHFYRICLGR